MSLDLARELSDYSTRLAIAAAQLDEIEAHRAVLVSDLTAAVSEFPPDQQLTALPFLQSIQARTALRKHAMTLDKLHADQKEVRDHARELRSFWTGIGLLLVALAAATLIRAKDASILLVIRLLAGLGVGLAVAYLPGFFNLDTSVKYRNNKVIFRAAGAFAALVMVYLFDPGWLGNLFHR